MSLRLIAAIVVAILFALAQMQAGTGGVPSASDVVANLSNRFSPTVASAQDNDGDDDEDNDDEDNDDEDNDEDNDDDDNDEDNDDEDNDDEDNDDEDNDDEDNDDGDNDDGDNDDGDNDDGDNDDGDNDDNGNDNGGFGDTDDGDPARFSSGPAVASTLPALEAVGTSNGGDVSISLGGERLTVKMFPWMPTGVTVTIRKANPALYGLVPGTMVGDLMFTIEARDAFGNALQELPAEVNLSLHYNDFEVSGLSESGVTISHLNTLDNQWRAAPKLFRDAGTNYVASSLTQLGVFVVHVP